MKYFLKELNNFWHRELIFNEVVIWTMSNAKIEEFSICTFIWIDWDKFTNDNYSKYYSLKPKSCDVLKILEENIDFIEFKKLYIADIKNINTKINQFELTKKLEWSYDLLKKIIEDERFIFIDKTEKIKLLSKGFIVSIYLHWFNETDIFWFSQKLGMIKRNLRGYFLQNPMPFWENFSEPIFKRTEEMNDLYNI